MEVAEQYQRWKRKGILMVWGGILIIILAVIVMAITEKAPQSDFNKLGIHLLLDDGRGSWDVAQWDDHIAYAGDVLPDGGFVVQLVRADDLDVDKWQGFMDSVHDHHLTPIIRLATIFDDESWIWLSPQADEDGHYISLAQTVADFVVGLDWHSDKHYIALLNEPNNGHEWGGRPDPVAYAQFVMDVAPMIKAVDENAVILNGAFDLHAPNTGELPFPDTDIYFMDAETFMDTMHTAQPDVFRQFDTWNSHAYPLGFSAPPWEREHGFIDISTGETNLTDAPRAVFSRSVNGYEWEIWKLSKYGVRDLPIIITETGWRHAETIDEQSLDAGEYPMAEQVTQYLDLLLLGNANQRVPDVPTGGWTGLLIDERVIGVIPFALNGTPDEWGHTNWLEMSPEGEILGEYPMMDLFRGYNTQE
jgi:hypothetical protein